MNTSQVSLARSTLPHARDLSYITTTSLGDIEESRTIDELKTLNMQHEQMLHQISSDRFQINMRPVEMSSHFIMP